MCQLSCVSIEVRRTAEIVGCNNRRHVCVRVDRDLMSSKFGDDCRVVRQIHFFLNVHIENVLISNNNLQFSEVGQTTCLYNYCEE